MLQSLVMALALSLSPIPSAPVAHEWREVFSPDGTITRQHLPKQIDTPLSPLTTLAATVTPLQQTGPSSQRFDLVFVDAFGANRYGLTIPPHLTSREFFEEIKLRLTPAGILAYNSPHGFGNAFTDALYKTIAAVFPERFVFDTKHSNVLIMAAVTPRQLSRAALLARGKAAAERGALTYPSLLPRLEHLENAPAPDAIDAPLLTDDYAPVDRLLRGKR